jgi:hypothetical protein
MAFLIKALMLYLVLAIAVSCAAPQFIFTNVNSPAEKTFLSWFNLHYDGTNIVMGNSTLASSTDSASKAFTDASSPSSAGSLLGWIDPIFQVFSWIPLIFKALFSPIILLASPAMAGAPPGIMFILGIPLVFMTIIGLIGFIRSGQL